MRNVARDGSIDTETDEEIAIRRAEWNRANPLAAKKLSAIALMDERRIATQYRKGRRPQNAYLDQLHKTRLRALTWQLARVRRAPAPTPRAGRAPRRARRRAHRVSAARVAAGDGGPPGGRRQPYSLAGSEACS